MSNRSIGRTRNEFISKRDSNCNCFDCFICLRLSNCLSRAQCAQHTHWLTVAIHSNSNVCPELAIILSDEITLGHFSFFWFWKLKTIFYVFVFHNKKTKYWSYNFPKTFSNLRTHKNCQKLWWAERQILDLLLAVCLYRTPLLCGACFTQQTDPKECFYQPNVAFSGVSHTDVNRMMWQSRSTSVDRCWLSCRCLRKLPERQPCI